jgi:hypothetical protein
MECEDAEGGASGYAEPSPDKQSQSRDLGEHKNLPYVSRCTFVGGGIGAKKSDVKEHDEKRAERQSDWKQAGGTAKDFASVWGGAHLGITSCP